MLKRLIKVMLILITIVTIIVIIEDNFVFTDYKDIYGVNLTKVNSKRIFGENNIHYYTFYTKKNDGSYGVEEYKSDITAIFLDLNENEQPYVIIRTGLFSRNVDLHLPLDALESDFDISLP